MSIDHDNMQNALQGKVQKKKNKVVKQRPLAGEDLILSLDLYSGHSSISRSNNHTGKPDKINGSLKKTIVLFYQAS